MTVKTDVNFRITGPCLSLLLRDCECSVSDQIGFLVGEKSSVTTQTISDEVMEEKKIETTITVNGTYPVGLPFVFSSSLGRVNGSSLKDVLGNCERDVVGWYSFRRNSNHVPSLREILLHREFCKVLKHIPPQYFIFLIITSGESDRNATHSYKFTFSTFPNRKFQPVSVVETNLGEHEDSAYRKSTVIDDSFKHLQEAINSLNGVNSSKLAVTTLHAELNKHVEALENSVSRLQAEIDSCSHKTESSGFSCTVVDQKLLSRQSDSSAFCSGKVVANRLSTEQ